MALEVGDSFFEKHLSIALNKPKTHLSTQLAAMVGPPTKRQKRAEVPDGKLPQKKFFRQRAHANPFSDHNLTYPESPAAFDWAELYPAYTVKEDKEDADASSTQEKSVGKISKQVEVADIGCGFGGLLFALAPIMPDKLLLGTTNRPKLL
jgi:tRNA (guanine-N7-)-methyltransferase